MLSHDHRRFWNPEELSNQQSRSLHGRGTRMSEQLPWTILILTTLLIHWLGITHISWRSASVCSIRSGNRLTEYHPKPRHATQYLVAVHGSRWTSETVGFEESYQICEKAAAYQMRVNLSRPVLFLALLRVRGWHVQRMASSNSLPHWRMWR